MELEIGDQLRTGRHVLGLTQGNVAASLGISQSEVSRRERGRSASLAGRDLTRHAATVGLRLSIKLWPVGGGTRDAAQARYIAAFVARVGRPWRVILEAAIPIAGDLRAVDVVLKSPSLLIAVEVITRLADLQAQIRAAQLKARDIGAGRLILVIAGTNANRAALSTVRATLVESFDMDTRRIVADLAAGRDPGRDGIVIL
jgi:transcriptional regulator with XRE-family HTH domain